MSMSMKSPIVGIMILIVVSGFAYYLGFDEGKKKGNVVGDKSQNCNGVVSATNKRLMEVEAKLKLRDGNQVSKLGYKMPQSYGFDPKYRYSRYTAIF